jgi:hypothetical protein
VQEFEFTLADKFQKLEIKKDVLLSCVIPDDVTRRPNMAPKEKEKRMLYTCQRKTERKIL